MNSKPTTPRDSYAALGGNVQSKPHSRHGSPNSDAPQSSTVPHLGSGPGCLSTSDRGISTGGEDPESLNSEYAPNRILHEVAYGRDRAKYLARGCATFAAARQVLVEMQRSSHNRARYEACPLAGVMPHQSKRASVDNPRPRLGSTLASRLASVRRDL